MTSVPMTLRDLQDHFSCFKLFWLLSSKNIALITDGVSTYGSKSIYVGLLLFWLTSKLKDYLRLPRVTNTAKMALCHYLGNSTKHVGLRCYNTDHYTSMLYMAYRIAPFSVTFSDLWCHSSPVLRACYAQLEKISALPRTSSVTWTLNDSVTSHLQGTCMYNETNGSLLKRRTPFLWKWKL